MRTACIVPAAMVVAATSGASFVGGAHEPRPVASDSPACCLQLVTAAQAGNAPQSSTHWQVVDKIADLALPAGIAPEKGLQVETILAARSVSAAFPEIHQIGGVRADALKWHPDGMALDVMVPDPSSAEGIALGDQIVAYALENWTRFDLNHVIWRGTMYFSDSQRPASGHYDHVHIATNGGGYPKGGELYLR